MFHTHIRKMASEKLTEVDLLLKGYMVLTPVTDIIENYDLVAEINGVLKKIQVKSAVPKGGRMIIDVRRSSNAKERYYADGAYDYLAIVDIESKRIAYVPKEEMTARSSINIWVCDEAEIPTRGRIKEPMLFKNYEEIR